MRGHWFYVLETSQARRYKISCDLAGPWQETTALAKPKPANDQCWAALRKGLSFSEHQGGLATPFSLPHSHFPKPRSSSLRPSSQTHLASVSRASLPAHGLTELHSSSSRKVPVLAGPARSETVADVREHLVERPLVICPEAVPWPWVRLWGLSNLILCWILSRAQPAPSTAFSLRAISVWSH